MKTASQVNGTVEKAAQSERPATTPSMLTTMIASLVKNQQWTMRQTYHPNTLGTMMESKNNVVDYLFSADNLKYTPWQKTFVFLPVKTISKQSVWFTWVYWRQRSIKHSIPQFPDRMFEKTEYATLQDILERKFRGLD